MSMRRPYCAWSTPRIVPADTASQFGEGTEFFMTHDHASPSLRSAITKLRIPLTSASGRRSTNFACRARQSRLFTWSARTTPATGRPLGTVTSKGYPLTRLVMGQKKAKTNFAVFALGEQHDGGTPP